MNDQHTAPRAPHRRRSPCRPRCPAPRRSRELPLSRARAVRYSAGVNGCQSGGHNTKNRTAGLSIPNRTPRIYRSRGREHHRPPGTHTPCLPAEFKSVGRRPARNETGGHRGCRAGTGLPGPGRHCPPVPARLARLHSLALTGPAATMTPPPASSSTRPAITSAGPAAPWTGHPARPGPSHGPRRLGPPGQLLLPPSPRRVRLRGG